MKAQLKIFCALTLLLLSISAFGQSNATTEILSEITPYGNGVNPTGPKPKTQTPKSPNPMPRFKPVLEDQETIIDGQKTREWETSFSPAEVEKQLLQSGFKVYNGAVISNTPSIWVPMDIADQQFTLCLGVHKNNRGSTIQLKRVYPEHSVENLPGYDIFLDSLRQVLN